MQTVNESQTVSQTVEVSALDLIELLEGYALNDLDEMVYAIQSIIATVNSDDDPWLYNNLWKSQEFLQGIILFYPYTVE